MDFIWILFAFMCGLAIKLVALPPLIGYLFAGFILHAYGVEADASLNTLADAGITLMLFSIGLKLNFGDLLKKEIWAPGLLHMGIWVLLCLPICLMLGALTIPYFTELNLAGAALVGFAASFSSTVCVVKLLEEQGEMKTRHGRLAIAILVIQDIAAVAFLVAATGKVPSLWAAALLLLIPARPLLGKILEKSGHGELLPLIGFFLAFGGYELFSLAGVKGDLGALVLGILLAPHHKASELAKSLLSFKDLFLIGFFLSIGFIALPTWSMFGIALLLSLLLPLKALLFYGLMTGFKLRGRTAFVSAIALTNFSEFGLIVASLSTDLGWLSKEWLVILALSVSISFIFTSLMYKNIHHFYHRNKGLISRFQRSDCLPDDRFEQPKPAEIMVIGLGRVGRGAFHSLHNEIGKKALGLDACTNTIGRLQQEGANVMVGDAENADFWEQLNFNSVKVVLLALPNIEDAINIAELMREANYQGKIAAIARYEDEREPLQEAGIDNVFNFFTEAGTGFAEESLQLLKA